MALPIGEITSIGEFLAVLTIAGFSISTYLSNGKIREEVDQKITRNYQRLDEVKKENENRYTSKEVCTIVHDQISKDLTEIKIDLKTLLKNNGNGNK